MPDTGPPWDLPYPDPVTGLVRDGGQDIKDLAEAVADALDDVGAEFITAGSDTVALDFSSDTVVSRAAAGAVTFTGSNYTEAKSATVRIVAGASARDLTFPADWKFVSFKPASLAANKVGVLAVTCFGTSASDALAAWAAEA